MNVIGLKRDNDRLRRENAELRERIAKLEARLPKQPEASKVAPEVKPYDARNPIAPGKDPYWDHVMGARKRRSWLNG